MSRDYRSNDEEMSLVMSLQIVQKLKKTAEDHSCKRVFANYQPALYNDLADSDSA